MKYQFTRGYIPLFFIILSLFTNKETNAQSIILSWSPNPEKDTKFYSIYKDTTSNPENEISRVYAPDTTYLDYDIVIGQGYYYRIAVVDSTDNISEFSDEIYIYADNLTRIELVSFSAEFIEDKIILKWDTASEGYSFGFEIQKSDNGKSFKKIGFVSNRGTSTGLSTYNFVDSELSYGKSYYRLKRIGADGNFEYSNVIKVELSFPEKFKLSQNYPNPFSASSGSAHGGNPETTIKYAIAKEGKVSLIIFNVLGKKIRKLVDEHKWAGYFEVKWNGKDDYGNDVRSGVYFCRMRGEGFNEAKKIILTR